MGGIWRGSGGDGRGVVGGHRQVLRGCLECNGEVSRTFRHSQCCPVAVPAEVCSGASACSDSGREPQHCAGSAAE
eukprot:12597738-Alexandrium_andersonii.AAC.1